MDLLEHTLEVAQRVSALLEAAGFEPVIIGAMALAIHKHPRQTGDFDFAVAVEPAELEALVPAFRGFGWTVDWSSPDAADPLGGVLTICAPDALPVQVVNFLNPPSQGFPALPRSAARSALRIEGMKASDLFHLIAFKLYAGGPKSELDVLELLARNQVDLAELRAFCRGLRLDRALERLLDRVR